MRFSARHGQRRRMPRPSSVPSMIFFVVLLVLAAWWRGSSAADKAMTTTFPIVDASAAAAAPDAASTALRMHRAYLSHPPHDTSLYDALRVSPNSTQAEITKSYRRLSREFHPDKVHRRRRQRLRKRRNGGGEAEKADRVEGRRRVEEDSDDESDSEAEAELARIREAYDVLRDDKTRLPYHRFGLSDAGDAADLLAGFDGGSNGSGDGGASERETLLRLMGHGPGVPRRGAAGFSPEQRHRQRIMFVAADLVETIRPLVEGAIAQEQLSHDVAQLCDSLKNAPLGAQILRCVGRAYRHAGKQFLRQHKRRRRRSIVAQAPLRIGLDLSDKARNGLRDAKYLLTAAISSGKLVLTERTAQAEAAARRKRAVGDVINGAIPTIGYYDDLGGLPGEDDLHCDDDDVTDEAVREQEREKAREAKIRALQVEALWKITKIELDRTVREACELILEGGYFFFPSHQAHDRSGWRQGGDGWVGSTGQVVPTEVGRLRAAAALVLIGDIMVKCSKEGTSWIE